MSRPSSRLVAVAAAALLILAGCASDANPESWAEARDQEGFPVRTNFIDACVEANTGERGFDDAQTSAYCGCAFDEVEEYFADDGDLVGADGERSPFQQFVDLEKDLRADPDDLPAVIRDLYEGCATDVG